MVEDVGEWYIFKCCYWVFVINFVVDGYFDCVDFLVGLYWCYQCLLWNELCLQFVGIVFWNGDDEVVVKIGFDLVLCVFLDVQCGNGLVFGIECNGIVGNEVLIE